MIIFGHIGAIDNDRRFASSMNGLFSISDNCFQSAPRRLLISELCIFGCSCAILRRCPRDHTFDFRECPFDDDDDNHYIT
ncbi:hypothetical protein DERF_001037 [Dermatophagoides farinae]|uniref:Uncharacterized protein n=1 Tax=Dermatophagoides farinae TaxID=6954 RepID=A0A922I9R5_DERFA|nr:hypothetical protein DERF_001037 [Dermatophagoides farinae]